MSYHLFGKLLENEINEADDDEVAGFAELKGGKTLKVRFSESSMGTNKFLEATRIDFLDRDDYKKSILDDVVDLDTVFNILPYEELEAVFLEDEGAGMAGDDDDDKPKSKSKKKSYKDDDDDDDDEKPKSRRASKKEEPEEDDDDEAPKSRRASKKAEPEDDDDDEKPKSRRSVKKAQPDDDDGDDEKPKRKASSKKADDDDDDDEAPKAKSEAKKKPEPDDDDDEAPKAKKGKGGKSAGGECPLSNGTFGKDFNKFDECDDCEVWSECGKAKKAK